MAKVLKTSGRFVWYGISAGLVGVYALTKAPAMQTGLSPEALQGVGGALLLLAGFNFMRSAETKSVDAESSATRIEPLVSSRSLDTETFPTSAAKSPIPSIQPRDPSTSVQQPARSAAMPIAISPNSEQVENPLPAPKTLLEDPAFRLALGYAKAIAQQTGTGTLNNAIMLLGIAKAPKNDMPKPVNALLAEETQLIGILANAINFPIDTAIEPATEIKLPLDPGLRKTIGSKEINSILLLTRRLFQETDIVYEELPEKIKLLAERDDFRAVLSYAAKISEHHGMAEVSAEALVVGAVVAQRAGALVNRPSILAHLHSNADSIKELLVARGWQDSEIDFPSSSSVSTTLPLSKDIVEAVSEADDVSDPFMVALNVGLGSAVRLKLKRRIAYHEAGHAVVSLVLRPDVQITEVSLIEKDDSDGHVAYEGSSPYFSRPTSRRDFMMTMSVLLAGRGAEQAKFGHDAIDAGATSDLQSATKLAWQAIAEWGLDPDFGPVNLPALASMNNVKAGWLWDLAQQRLQAVMKETAGRTELILNENWQTVEAIALAVLAKDRLTQDEVMELAQGLSDPQSSAARH